MVLLRVTTGGERRRRRGADSIVRNLNKSIFFSLKAAIFQSDGYCKHHSSTQHFETPHSYSPFKRCGKMRKILHVYASRGRSVCTKAPKGQIVFTDNEMYLLSCSGFCVPTATVWLTVQHLTQVHQHISVSDTKKTLSTIKMLLSLPAQSLMM